MRFDGARESGVGLWGKLSVDTSKDGLNYIYVLASKMQLIRPESPNVYLCVCIFFSPRLLMFRFHISSTQNIMVVTRRFHT